MAGKLRVTWKKSAIRREKSQGETIRGLGLRKMNQTRILEDTPAVRGMVFKVRHLVEVEEVKE
jgi:large subunit ribosomal protein L30